MSLIFLQSACGRKKHSQTPPPDSQQIELNSVSGGSLRYYKDIEKILHDRLLRDTASQLNLGGYLAEDRNDFDNIVQLERPGGLLSLLGSYSGTGLLQSYSNATPNPLNMMLWLIILEGFANDLAQLCSGENIYEWKSSLETTIKKLCQSSSEVEAWEQLWQLVLRSDGTQRDQQLWIEQNHPQNATEDFSVHLKKMLLSLLYSPTFLLKK